MGKTSFLKFALFTLFAIVGNAFQAYYRQQLLSCRVRKDVLDNTLYQQKHYHHHRRRLVPLSYGKPKDPSIIEYNRQYLSNTLGFSEEKLDKIASKPKQSGGNILAAEIGILDERVNWLQNRLSLNDNEIKKVIQSQPNILAMKDDRLESKIDYLQNRLLLDDTSLRKLLITVPTILTFSIDNIEHKSVWLQERLMLDEAALSKLIQRLPQIINLSITDNMEPKLDWIQERLLLDDTALSKLVKRMPQILGLSTDNIEPKLDWLQERLSLTDDELSKMIQRQSPLIGCNIDSNLDPTLNFYIDVLGKEEALALVIRDPSALSRSLEKRLKPRLKQALDAGIVIDSRSIQAVMKLTIYQWDMKVAKRMGKIKAI